MSTGLFSFFGTAVSFTIVGILVAIVIAIISLVKDKKNRLIALIILFIVVLLIIIVAYVETSNNKTNLANESHTVIPESVEQYQNDNNSIERVKVTNVVNEQNEDKSLEQTINDTYTTNEETSYSNKDNSKSENISANSHQSTDNTTDNSTKAILSTTQSTTKLNSTEELLPDIYDANGYLINGMFGSDKYDTYNRFDKNDNKWAFYNRDDVVDLEMCNIELEFYDENDIKLEGGTVFVSVPQALQDGQEYWMGLVPTNESTENETFRFQAGLYRFAVEYEAEKKWYQSDCVFIDDDATYLIRVHEGHLS